MKRGLPPGPISLGASTRVHAADAVQMRIGRPDNDIVLNGPSVAEHRAVISWPAGYAISDAANSTGTFVNGQRSAALTEPWRSSYASPASTALR